MGGPLRPVPLAVQVLRKNLYKPSFLTDTLKVTVTGTGLFLGTCTEVGTGSINTNYAISLKQAGTPEKTCTGADYDTRVIVGFFYYDPNVIVWLFDHASYGTRAIANR